MSRSRFSSEKMQDLELRLAPSFLSKGAVLASNFSRGPPEFITIVDDDDEDDVQMYRPSSSRETIMFFPCSSSSLTESKEEDLDLRLGVRASNGHSGNSKGRDTCCWKCCKASSSQLSDFMEVKLRCTICMDTMKEETSTLCGHIFCKPCITNAVQVLKRCPTCREKLSISSIHRIYLPGATS